MEQKYYEVEIAIRKRVKAVDGEAAIRAVVSQYLNDELKLETKVRQLSEAEAGVQERIDDNKNHPDRRWSHG